MRRVGLTGGIATGKSKVGGVLRGCGVSVLDADQAARVVVARGQPLLDQIAAHFGAEVLLADGALNRRRLREVILANPSARRDLDAMTHPAIWALLEAQLRALADGGTPIAVVEAALMVEAGWHRHFDALLVATCPEVEQVRRVMIRDRVSREGAHAVLEAQLPNRDKVALADAVIDTYGPVELLPDKVRVAWVQLARGLPAASSCG
ncbi:MAG: dephospho-CoA kinase [Deltaproteobacteria bacterium]|nr:dephospho-CoA kinase [Deltaproteobacteria bacterium]